MSQLLSETIGQIFNEKKTFIESVRERRKIRRQRIAQLFQRFQFSEHDSQEAVAAAAAGAATTAGEAGAGEGDRSEQQDSCIPDESKGSVNNTSPAPLPPATTPHTKTSRLSFDPNNESQLQEEIQRILDRGDDDDLLFHEDDSVDEDEDNGEEVYGEDEETSEFAKKPSAEDGTQR
jgi:hypothetical protein